MLSNHLECNYSRFLSGLLSLTHELSSLFSIPQPAGMISHSRGNVKMSDDLVRRSTNWLAFIDLPLLAAYHNATA